MITGRSGAACPAKGDPFDIPAAPASSSTIPPGYISPGGAVGVAAGTAIGMGGLMFLVRA